jgi:hypothetical protein
MAPLSDIAAIPIAASPRAGCCGIFSCCLHRCPRLARRPGWRHRGGGHGVQEDRCKGATASAVRREINIYPLIMGYISPHPVTTHGLRPRGGALMGGSQFVPQNVRSSSTSFGPWPLVVLEDHRKAVSQRRLSGEHGSGWSHRFRSAATDLFTLSLLLHWLSSSGVQRGWARPFRPATLSFRGLCTHFCMIYHGPARHRKHPPPAPTASRSRQGGVTRGFPCRLGAFHISAIHRRCK